MTTPKIRRSKFKSYLNTGTAMSPTWSLIGDGVTTGKVNMNPKTTEENYIHEETASMSLDSYAPNMPIKQTAKEGDPVFEMAFDLYQERSILGDAEKELIHVYLFQTPADGWYPAEKQSVAISIDDVGGDGGKPVEINYTLNYNGDGTPGWFNPVTAAFVAIEDIDTTLTALSFTTPLLTLTPSFSAGVLTYTAPTTSFTNIVTATPADPDSSVVITNGATVLESGDPITFTTGANVVTFEVIVGDVSTTYTVTVTKS